MSGSSSQNRNADDDAREAVVSDKLVRKICDDVGTCWEDLGIELELSSAVVHNVDAEFRRCREKAREILRLWRQKQGNAATVKSLEGALMRIDKTAIAETLLASQIDLQNEGQREGAQAPTSRTRNGDSNHGNVHGGNIGDVKVESSNHVTIITNMHGGFNLYASKQE